MVTLINPVLIQGSSEGEPLKVAGGAHIHGELPTERDWRRILPLMRNRLKKNIIMLYHSNHWHMKNIWRYYQSDFTRIDYHGRLFSEKRCNKKTHNCAMRRNI